MRMLRRLLASVFFCLCVLIPSALAQGETHALLVACSDFISQPDLGAAISGNLHMVGSALISADRPLSSLSIEDGTIGTAEAFSAAVTDAFSEAGEDDLSILYLCTHGVLSADDNQVYLLLGDGQNESALSAQQLYDCIAPIQGEKLLILDACFSGALIGRGQPAYSAPPAAPAQDGFLSPFLLDSSIHVLTSANGYESSWYYDSENLSTGAVSYFASALSSGLGLYGAAEADINGDGQVMLSELHRHLSVAVPSSSSQLLSTRANALVLPSSSSAILSRPLMGFSYGSSLLTADDPTLDFSFTVTQDSAVVQYRLVDYTDGSWDWQHARTFLDGGDREDGTLSPGRKSRVLSLDGLTHGEGGYLMLQVFSVSPEGALLLCSERLIAVQGASDDAQLSLFTREDFALPGLRELPIAVRLSVPAEITVSVYDEHGALIRRIASSQLTRPTRDNVTRLYWDGRDDSGTPVPAGCYTITAEARIGGVRQKALREVTVVSP